MENDIRQVYIQKNLDNQNETTQVQVKSLMWYVGCLIVTGVTWIYAALLITGIISVQ